MSLSNTITIYCLTRACSGKWVKIRFPKLSNLTKQRLVLMRYLKLKEQVEHAVAILETGKKLDQINFRKDFWDCFGDKKKIGQWVTDTSPVTTPETIAGRISAPVPFSLRKWRLSVCRLNVQLTLARRYGNFFHSFIGCSSSNIQYKFVIQHTHTHTKDEAKTQKG